ncbi:ribosome biogenesis protein Nop16 [Xylariaceae sp. FL0016]|nr:ribosome biogenesis protein Nop16 [Xylariaceae sp. FL0016]
MGRDLQKRKRRSSRPAIRQPTSTRSKRLLNPLGNSTVAKNWNKNETTTQNYRRLGLVSRLRAPTGGVEPHLKSTSTSPATAAKPSTSTKPADPFTITPTSNAVVTEARVERDPATGKILRILSTTGARRRANPLNDPLAELDSDSESGADANADAEEWDGFEDGSEDGDDNAIFRQLEAEANRPVEKKPRTQSTREAEWLERLVARHGGDTRAMARDRRLNPMQQTEADIQRRLRKWKGETS